MSIRLNAVVNSDLTLGDKLNILADAGVDVEDIGVNEVRHCLGLNNTLDIDDAEDIFEDIVKGTIIQALFAKIEKLESTVEQLQEEIILLERASGQ